MTGQHKVFMREAIRIALENVKNGGGPFGAVVVKDGAIIGKGTNSVTIDNDPSAHAEVNAIRDACKNMNSFQLTGCDIYTSCEPCPMCFGAIYWARPERIFFGSNKKDAADAGFDDSFIYNEIELPCGSRKIKAIQLLQDEAAEVFQLWHNTEDKIEY
jgi:guanine deaminase